MAITVVANPVTLSWTDYTSQRVVLDPADGTAQDAFTAFNYDLPDLPPRVVGGQYALAETMHLTITPVALVRSGARQGADLLSHEQLHYDVGVAIARVVARELSRLRAPSLSVLGAALNQVVQLHFHRRAGLIQRRYDLDTAHGTNHHYQHAWKRGMRHCLSHPHSHHLMGFWL